LTALILEVVWIAFGRPDVIGMYKRATGKTMSEKKEDKLVKDAKKNGVLMN